LTFILFLVEIINVCFACTQSFPLMAHRNESAGRKASGLTALTFESWFMAAGPLESAVRPGIVIGAHMHINIRYSLFATGFAILAGGVQAAGTSDCTFASSNSVFSDEVSAPCNNDNVQGSHGTEIVSMTANLKDSEKSKHHDPLLAYWGLSDGFVNMPLNKYSTVGFGLRYNYNNADIDSVQLRWSREF
jgi:hypothetical protein